MKTISYITILSALLMASCGKSGGASADGGAKASPASPPVGEDSIPDQDLAGIIEGQGWVFAQGFAQLKAKEGLLSLSFSEKKQNLECPLMIDGEKLLLTQAPSQKGTFALGQGTSPLTATFAIRKEGQFKNYVSTLGLIVIEEITDSQVSGKIGVKLDEQTMVGGKFKLPLCKAGSEPTPPQPRPLPALPPDTDERSLGEFELKVGQGPRTRSFNDLDIGEPKAKTVYGDFRLQPTSNLELSFYQGTSSGFNCSPFGLKRSFYIYKYGLSGELLDSKIIEGYPSRFIFESSYLYRIRVKVSNFPEYCPGVSTSFETYRH